MNCSFLPSKKSTIICYTKFLPHSRAKLMSQTNLLIQLTFANRKSHPQELSKSNYTEHRSMAQVHAFRNSSTLLQKYIIPVSNAGICVQAFRSHPNPMSRCNHILFDKFQCIKHKQFIQAVTSHVRTHIIRTLRSCLFLSLSLGRMKIPLKTICFSARSDQFSV